MSATLLRFTGSYRPNSPLRAAHTQGNDQPMPLTGFSSWLRANNCCEGTIADRLAVVAMFARSHLRFPDVSATQVSLWLGRPSYAQWTRATYYGHLRSFFRFATMTGLVEADPMVGMVRPRPGKSVPRPLTPAQVALVMGHAGVNQKAWLTLGLFAGLRAHEIAKVRGEDVDEDQLFVFGKGGQGAFVPTHPKVWELAQTRASTGWWSSHRRVARARYCPST
jgi:integrase